MARKGPKKVSRRDDRDLERSAERRKAQSVAARAKNTEQVLNVYKVQSNPNIAKSKGERRALREALSAEGVSLERWNSGKFEECFFHIARDRYLNRKFSDIYSALGDDMNTTELESDAWLQMYLHVPEDYREKVSKVIEPFGSSQCDENIIPFENKAPKIKLSRNKAKALAEGVPAVQSTSNNVKEDCVVQSELVELRSEEPSSQYTTVPEGHVKVINLDHEILCADATGKVFWSTQSDAEHSSWKVEAITPGKYHLRSSHSRFLCHCMWAGVVADRTNASWWEEWTISAMEDEKTSSGDGLFTIRSWRNVYIGKNGDKVTLTDKVDAICKFRMVKLVEISNCF